MGHARATRRSLELARRSGANPYPPRAPPRAPATRPGAAEGETVRRGDTAERTPLRVTRRAEAADWRPGAARARGRGCAS